MKVSFFCTRPNRISFTSRVVFESPAGRLTTAQKDFIDKFEESDDTEKIADMNCEYLGEGISAKAYFSPLYDFVIKQTKNDSALPRKERYASGSLYQENEILQRINDHVTHTQRGVAYVETEKDGQFLISTLVDGERANCVVNPYNEENMSRLLRTLYRLDKNGIINTDLTGSNVLVTPSQANIIDYQWGEIFDAGSYNDFKYIQLPQFEAPSNMTTFEGAGLTGYIEQHPEPRKFLKEYLTIKSKYIDKKIHKLEKLYEETGSYYLPERIEFEKSKAHVYKNITDDVLNVELLKMRLMKNHRRQYTCIDPEVVKSRNVLEAIKWCADGYLVSNCLKNYPVNLDNYDEESQKYFNFMKRYGEFGVNRAKEEYPETLKWIAKMLDGSEERKDNIFYSGEIGPINIKKNPLGDLEFSNYSNTASFQAKASATNQKVNELADKFIRLYRYNGYAYSVYDDIDELFT